MHLHAERHHGDLTEREFSLDGVPGVLWIPDSASASTPAPLILLGHPGRMGAMYPRLLARARDAAAQGFATVTIELPWSGDRPASAAVTLARADLRATVQAGRAPDDDLISRLILPLVEHAVPEWRATMDAVLELPEVGGPVGYSGGLLAVGIRLALADPRIVAAGFFAGSFVPRSIVSEAAQVTIPVHMLLQWDDEGNDRQLALDVFDAFGSADKTLQANTGGHTGVPAHAGEDAARFFARHLTAPAD